MLWRNKDKDNGIWQVARDLLDKGDPRFVDEIRRITNGKDLGDYASHWFADERPQAHQFLLEYLKRPLNAFRHELLVKRLFKMSEHARDNELMAHFLVAFDRSIRRQIVTKNVTKRAWARSKKEGEAKLKEWQSQGFTGVVEKYRDSAWRVEAILAQSAKKKPKR